MTMALAAATLHQPVVVVASGPPRVAVAVAVAGLAVDAVAVRRLGHPMQHAVRPLLLRALRALLLLLAVAAAR